MRTSFKASVLFVSLIAAQSISTILSEQSGLQTFTAYISQFPDLLAQLDTGNFTVLAPTDGAFASYSANGGNLNLTSNDEIEALLHYHILQGLHPFESFTTSPQFLPTILTNNNYTNVTGGQRVETISENGAVSMYSAVKAMSRIVTPDALFIGGVIHTIDRVLGIPLPVPATITKAGLNDLVALLSKYGLLTDPEVLATVAGLHDLTLFVANDPRYSGSYTGWQNLSTQQLRSIFESAIHTGTIGYSTSLTNQSTFETLEGKNVTITVSGSTIYVDASKITSRDYLTSNGVLQVINSPLTPNTSDARPTIIPPPTPPTPGLSKGAKAGIGIAVTAIVLACLACVTFLVSTREKKRFEQHRQQQQLHYDNLRTPSRIHEKEAEPHRVWELDGTQRSELSGDGQSRPTDSERRSWLFYKRISIFSRPGV